MRGKDSWFDELDGTLDVNLNRHSFDCKALVPLVCDPQATCRLRLGELGEPAQGSPAA